MTAATPRSRQTATITSLAGVPAQRPVTRTTPVQRHRAHLDRLLGLRSQLARVVAERRSHRMEDEAELWSQQLAVEAAIRDLDPAVYSDRWGHWVERDATLEHEPTAMAAWCSICQTIARRAGVNLVRPIVDDEGPCSVAVLDAVEAA